MTETNHLEVNEAFKKEALKKFSGGDTTTDIAAGSPENRSIWCFGIEHGTYKSGVDENLKTRAKEGKFDKTYSIEQQLTFPYNKKLFKLLAVVHGDDIQDYETFAKEHQPFVKDTPGYCKGNLYPYGFRTVSDYTEAAQKYIGLPDKNKYYAWCNKHRLPIIRSWVEAHKPKVFIGVGITCRTQFAQAVFEENITFLEKTITINDKKKRLFSYTKGWKKLIVVPHLSYYQHCLNNDESIELAGKHIAKIMQT